MRTRFRAVLCAVLVISVLTGCADQQAGSAAPEIAVDVAQPGETWRDEIKPAIASGRVGGTGSPCDLPVSFDLRDGQPSDGGKRERVLGVAVSGVLVLVVLSGLDTEQYEAMLPAYLLARRSLAPAD